MSESVRVWDCMKKLFLVLPVVILAACATAPEVVDGAGGLEQRVAERWSLLVKGKVVEAYGFLSPAAREITSLEKYQGSLKPGMWREAKVGKSVCASEDVCTVEVHVSYSYKPKGLPVYEGVRTLPETWRKDAGQWWYVPDL